MANGTSNLEKQMETTTNVAQTATGAVTDSIAESSTNVTHTTAIIEEPFPGNPPEPSYWHKWKMPGVAIVVVAVLVLVRLWMKKEARNFAKESENKVLDDILAGIGQSGKDSLREELSAMLAGTASPSNPLLASILRIEESFEKQSNGQYLRRISILRRKEGSSGTLTKIESEVGWEYLPDAVRGEFIRSRRDRVVRKIYESKEGD